jgi:hypothetical protein
MIKKFQHLLSKLSDREVIELFFWKRDKAPKTKVRNASPKSEATAKPSIAEK